MTCPDDFPTAIYLRNGKLFKNYKRPLLTDCVRLGVCETIDCELFQLWNFIFPANGVAIIIILLLSFCLFLLVYRLPDERSFLCLLNGFLIIAVWCRKICVIYSRLLNENYHPKVFVWNKVSIYLRLDVYFTRDYNPVFFSKFRE